MSGGSAEAKQQMEYRTLGKTGLKISTLSFGFWATFGVKEGLDTAINVMRVARNWGVNLFDNAEAYGEPNGKAEEIMGQALKALVAEDPKLWRRSDLVITTKIFWGGGGENERGLSRKHIMEAMDTCLKRLQMDYVDLVFCHRPDKLTPTLETVQAFTDVIRSGKAHYWGTSEWSAQQFTEAYWIAKMNNLIPPVMEQPQYNMFVRDRVEKEYERLYDYPYGMGTTIWSPLASGVLTGKYNKGIPAGSRLGHKGYEFLKNRWDAEKAVKIPKVEKLMEIAQKKLGCSVTQLAIAWCVKNPNVSTVLLGSTKVSQLEENLAALDVARRIDASTMEEIDAILGNKPAMPSDWGRKLVSTTV